MTRQHLLAAALAVSLMSAGSLATGQSATYQTALRSVSNWRSEALAHLDVTDFQLAKHSTLRCVRLNNYWCLKDVGWRGGVGRDGDNHTAFSDGYFATRAAVRNFRTAYVHHGRKSAWQIMSAYAPPDDCIGSKAGTLPDGTCKWGFNPTEKYARMVVAGIADDPHADIDLFDAKGKANLPVLVRFLQNMSAFETAGLRVRKETVERGICMEDGSCG